MCMIYAQWHVVEKFSHVTIHDAEGGYVGNMKNAAVAISVVNEHNKRLAESFNPPQNGWISAKTINQQTSVAA
jgi:hypothetical protein